MIYILNKSHHQINNVHSGSYILKPLYTLLKKKKLVFSLNWLDKLKGNDTRILFGTNI
jgi:hypothetical protein